MVLKVSHEFLSNEVFPFPQLAHPANRPRPAGSAGGRLLHPRSAALLLSHGVTLARGNMVGPYTTPAIGKLTRMGTELVEFVLTVIRQSPHYQNPALTYLPVKVCPMRSPERRV
jgi:hypothetical protein